MLNPNVQICSGIVLLKNGWTSYGKTTVQTANTCSFDSLYFAVAAMYSDYDTVKKQIDDLDATCAFSTMIYTMFTHYDRAATKFSSLHRQRNAILYPIFESSALKFDSGLVLVNCVANVNFIIPRVLLEKLYSYSRTKECTQCKKKATSKRCFIDINFEEYRKRSITNLNSFLLNTLIAERPSACSCGNPQIFTEASFSNFIMIDLHLETTIKLLALKDIPLSLDILGVIFKLSACIEFIGKLSEDPNFHNDDQAHYITHILRANNQWQIYDDTKSKMSHSKINEKIQGQVLFYVKSA